MPQQDHSPADFVRVEADALHQLAQRLDGPMREPFARAVAIFLACTANGGRVIVTGMGKSGIIARKIASTMRSTGTPSQFLHPAEAIHGDLGMLGPKDVILALSYSGETEELLRLLPVLKRLGDGIVSLCGCATSTLAKASTIFLDASVSEEACSLNLAPTASTTVMLALGDALALEASRRNGFATQHFADLHPGGKLGRRLARVHQLMHSGADLPQVAPTTPMPEVIHEMSRKRLGMTTVLDGGKLAGIISDGDLRRLLERDGGNALSHTAGEIMNPAPLTISTEAFASEALTLMEERKITSLIAVAPDGSVGGVLHLHDLWTLEPM